MRRRTQRILASDGASKVMAAVKSTSEDSIADDYRSAEDSRMGMRGDPDLISRQRDTNAVYQRDSSYPTVSRPLLFREDGRQYRLGRYQQIRMPVVREHALFV